MNPTIPGFLEVSKDEFFKALRADKRDVMPSRMNTRDALGMQYTSWECVRTREVFGRTYCNYMGAVSALYLKD